MRFILYFSLILIFAGYKITGDVCIRTAISATHLERQTEASRGGGSSRGVAGDGGGVEGFGA